MCTSAKLPCEPRHLPPYRSHPPTSSSSAATRVRVDMRARCTAVRTSSNVMPCMERQVRTAGPQLTSREAGCSSLAEGARMAWRQAMSHQPPHRIPTKHPGASPHLSVLVHAAVEGGADGQA